MADSSQEEPTPRGNPILRWSIALLCCLPVLDLVGGVVVRSRVPTEADWERAGSYVRGEFEPGDLVVAAPEWTDSLVYEQIGDLVSLGAAGRSDDEAFSRVWAFSTRGHLPRQYAEHAAAVFERFGRVTVFRWDLGPSPVRYMFVDHLREAKVERLVGGAARPCPWRRMPWGRSGLHWGSMFPDERFQCDPGAAHLFVGETVNEDLDIRPRHCIWQHPAGAEPIRTTFENVPLGERLVFYGGIYYQHERVMNGGVVDVTLRVDGDVLGTFQHRDGDGWARESFSLVELGRERGTVSVEVTSPAPHLRSFCWNAFTADAPRSEGNR